MRCFVVVSLDAVTVTQFPNSERLGGTETSCYHQHAPHDPIVLTEPSPGNGNKLCTSQNMGYHRSADILQLKHFGSYPVRHGPKAQSAQFRHIFGYLPT